MLLYEVFQTWGSLRESSMLGKKEITPSELVTARIQKSEEDIMSLVGGEFDHGVVRDIREKTRKMIEGEVQILAQRAQEIQEAIKRGIGIIIGVHESKKAFLRTKDSRLIDMPHDLEGSYILRAPLLARFQSLPHLPKGLSPVIDDSLRQKITEWTSYILPEYAGRRMECLRAMTASEVMYYVTKNWQYPYFLKTLAKNAAMEIWKYDDLEAFFIQVKHDEEAHDSTGYIVSDVMNIQSDDVGKREFRAYIVEGKVINISRNQIDSGDKLTQEELYLVSVNPIIPHYEAPSVVVG